MSEIITSRQNGNGQYIYPDGTVIKVDISTVYNDVKLVSRSYGPRDWNQGGGVDNTVGILYNIEVRGVLDKFIIPYPPEYFAQAAKDYKGTTKDDRREFLRDQIEKLGRSWTVYQALLAKLQSIAATLDGKSDVATWAASIGSVAIATANPYAVGAGAVLTGFGLLIGWFSKRQASDTVAALRPRATRLGIEAAQIGAYHEAYTKELKGSPFLALLIAGGLAIAAYQSGSS